MYYSPFLPGHHATTRCEQLRVNCCWVLTVSLLQCMFSAFLFPFRSPVYDTEEKTELSEVKWFLQGPTSLSEVVWLEFSHHCTAFPYFSWSRFPVTGDELSEACTESWPRQWAHLLSQPVEKHNCKGAGQSLWTLCPFLSPFGRR